MWRARLTKRERKTILSLAPNDSATFFVALVFRALRSLSHSEEEAGWARGSGDLTNLEKVIQYSALFEAAPYQLKSGRDVKPVVSSVLDTDSQSLRR